jgi:predicted dehydrogenase
MQQREGTVLLVRVGIVGFSPPKGWAATAHVPALQNVGVPFAIHGVANRSLASSSTAAAAVSARAFSHYSDLTSDPEIDLVVVAVKVPHHSEIIRSAIASGKAVLSEWPLARNYTEAQQLAELARSSGTLAAVGTQAIYAPAIKRLRDLVAGGDLGEILSVRLSGYGMTWGHTIEARNAYLLDRTNGATMLSVAVGHALAALRSVVGPLASVQSHLANRRNQMSIKETGEHRRMTSPDHVQISAVTQAGVPVSIVYAGGLPRGPGLHLQVDGTDRSARITGPSGLIEMSPLTLEVSGEGGGHWELVQGPVENPVWDGVAQLYTNIAEVFSGRPKGMLPTFDDGLDLHRVLQAIEDAAETGCAVKL